MFKKLRPILLTFIVFVIAFTGCVPKEGPKPQPMPSSSVTKVHFIDVGQADCILIESEGKYMLVDAGNNDDDETIKNYLDNIGVKKLEYVIGTHPHEDHIGSLDKVIDNYDIGAVIMPEKTNTTKTFKDVLKSIENKGLQITLPNTGDKYEIGSAEFTILSPNADYGDEINDWSVGIKLVYGDTSFVMCGDAEKEAEEDIINTGMDLSADVLKLGHHGSSTSSSEEFLEAVNPEYVVIMCETGNKYGHPHKETLEKIKNHGYTAFRTDEQGTIVAETDGSSITWSTSPAIEGSSNSKQSEASSETSYYILNTKTKKFHYAECRNVETISDENKEEYNGERDELISEGYSPCGNCKP